MKKKKYLMLIAAITVSSAFLLNGCGFELPLSSGNTAISAETENLTDGSIQAYSRWYNSDNEKLSGATVSIYDGSELIVEATTDADGNLEACTLPGNTELKCVVTDASGNELANSKFIYKISPDYPSLTIYTARDDSDVQEINIPADRTVLSMAMYVTEDSAVSHANITPYDADAASGTEQTPEGSADPAAEGETDQPQDGQADPNADGQADPNADGQADPNADGQADPNANGQADPAAE